jgi:MFS family permease
VQKTLLTSWPLFFGLAMLMVGNGLQNTLLGIRASIENFDTTVIGLVMSFYFIGFLAGSRLMPKLIIKVGHIRVFAALAALASTTVLLHGLFLNPYAWCIIRVFTGLSFAGLFIVIESWLNNITTNSTRGKIMAIYLVILYGAMVIGQFLLLAADPSGMELFVLTSVLISMALIPISLSSRPAPKFAEPEHISVKNLYKSSPLGIFGVAISGMAAATLFGLGAVYGEKIGLSLKQISTFMAAFILGGVLFQMPIGWLSDKYDRRRVLIYAAYTASFFAVLGYFAFAQGFIVLLITMFFLGGAALSIYALAVAHTNDHLGSSQIIAASASILMLNSLGACMGPFIASAVMDYINTQSYYLFIALLYFSIATFGVYRTFRRPPVPLQDQSDYFPMTESNSVVSMQIAHESSQTMKKME